MNPSNQKIAIIGAGVAGMACAIRLANRGHHVTIFEANSYPGGKLTQFQLADYRFDAGPSLFTMPQYVDELVGLAGKSKEAFQYSKLDTICNYYWNDGSNFKANADIERLDREASSFFKIKVGSLAKHLKACEKKYNSAGKIFLENSLHRLKTWTNGKVLSALLKIPGMDIFSSMHRVHQNVSSSKKLTQLLDRFATYNGSDPFKASGMLSMIPHFEHGIGAFFPKGGMHAITETLVTLGEKVKVDFRFDSPVEKILKKDGKAVGVKVGGNELMYDKVVSNMDSFFTYSKLLEDNKESQRIDKQERSTSALIFYWGVKKEFPQLDLHNIFFSQNYKEEFQALSDKVISDDPTIYVNITSKFNKADAPKGCENWFVMINVPYDEGIDWEKEIPRVKQRVIQKLNGILKVKMEELIEVEQLLNPKEIEQKTSSYKGALYGTSSNSLNAAFLRQSNFSRKYKNLYFCGGSVHPGGGIPLCLLSAKITDQLIHDGY